MTESSYNKAQTEVEVTHAEALNEIAYQRSFGSGLTMTALAIAAIGTNGTQRPFAGKWVGLIQRTWFSRDLTALMSLTEVRRNLVWMVTQGWLTQTAQDEFRRTGAFDRVLRTLEVGVGPAFPALRTAELTLSMGCHGQGNELAYAVDFEDGHVARYRTEDGVFYSAPDAIASLRTRGHWPCVAPLDWRTLCAAERLEAGTNGFFWNDQVCRNWYLWLGLKGPWNADQRVVSYRAGDAAFLNRASQVGLLREAHRFIAHLRALSSGELIEDTTGRFVERPDNFCTVKPIPNSRDHGTSLLVTVRGRPECFGDLNSRIGLAPDRPAYSKCYITALDRDDDICELLKRAKRKRKKEGLPSSSLD